MDELLDLLAKYIQKGKEFIGVIDGKAKQASRKRVSAYGYGADSNVVDDLIKIGDLKMLILNLNVRFLQDFLYG